MCFFWEGGVVTKQGAAYISSERRSQLKLSINRCDRESLTELRGDWFSRLSVKRLARVFEAAGEKRRVFQRGFLFISLFPVA